MVNRRSRRFLLAVPAALTACAAITNCSVLTNSDLVTFYTLTDGSTPFTPTDSSIVDAPSSDVVGIEPDAGPAPSICKGRSDLFCSDFESSAKPEGEWTTKVVTAGTLTRESNPLGWNSHAAHTMVPRTSASYRTALQQTLSGNHTAIQIDFDFYWDAPIWQNGDINVSPVFFHYEGWNLSVGVFLNTDTVPTLSFDTVGYFSGGNNASIPWPTGVWSHVRIQFHPKAGGSNLKMFIGPAGQEPTQVLDTNKPLPISVPTAPGDLTLSVGLYGANSPEPAFNAYYDNVIVNAIP